MQTQAGLARVLGAESRAGGRQHLRPKSAGLGGDKDPPLRGCFCLRWHELKKSCRVESFSRRLPGPAASPGALAATLHCTYYCLSLQRVPSQ